MLEKTSEFSQVSFSWKLLFFAFFFFFLGGGLRYIMAARIFIFFLIISNRLEKKILLSQYFLPNVYLKHWKKKQKRKRQTLFFFALWRFHFCTKICKQNSCDCGLYSSSHGAHQPDVCWCEICNQEGRGVWGWGNITFLIRNTFFVLRMTRVEAFVSGTAFRYVTYVFWHIFVILVAFNRVVGKIVI